MNDGERTLQHQVDEEEPRDRLHRQTLTVEEFAVLAGIGRSTAYEAARRGEIPARRIGNRYVIPVVLTRAWLVPGRYGPGMAAEPECVSVADPQPDVRPEISALGTGSGVWCVERHLRDSPGRAVRGRKPLSPPT